MTPELTYDEEGDALIIRLSDEQPFEGEDVAPDITVHRDRLGRIVEVEIIAASTGVAPGRWLTATRAASGLAPAAE